MKAATGILVCAIVSLCSATNDHTCITVADGNSPSVNARSDCQEGDIEWNNPDGTLTVTFNPDHLKKFRLCVRFYKGEACTLLHDVTAGRDVDLTEEVKYTGEEKCTNSAGNEVVVQFELRHNHDQHIPHSKTIYSYRVLPVRHGGK